MTLEELKIDYLGFKKHIRPVVFRHTVTLINGIFFTVVSLLIFFGEFHEALFLSVVLVLNISVGIVQDMRAKLSLEKLQVLMAPKILRLDENGKDEVIALEEITVGDKLRLALGDQIPSDGRLVESDGLEVNEALLTGESKNIQKPINANVLAGSIVTAGQAVMEVSDIPKNSFVVRMTERIKQYSYVLSPIQQTLTNFIRFMTYLLLVVIAYTVFQGITQKFLMVRVVKGIASLTSTLVPQGLILATTVFFAYGALRLFKRQVLLQEINATEKLGLIKNLCVDKTGTLTENQPQVESVVYFGDHNLTKVKDLLAGYLLKNIKTSQTAVALQNFAAQRFEGEVLHTLAFSSERKFGGVTLKTGSEVFSLVLGAPDVLQSKLSGSEVGEWVESNVVKFALEAKRLVLLARTSDSLEDFESVRLLPVALFVMTNPLRSGTREIIDFFQSRKVSIRVISGDHPLTVKAIAEQAGIRGADMVITGEELARWDDEAFSERVPAYHVFARVLPEQKEKIIEELKKNGFTAMIGDGANDALSIKKADLGIAMFDGAPATRQIAQIVLMNNSFAALPAGVKIAQTIITNIELIASVFFYKVVTGFLIFAILAYLGFIYPLSPRNDTIVGYSTVWLAIVYWSLFPAQNARYVSKSFLKKIFPFASVYGVLSALACVIVFLLGPEKMQNTGSNIYVVLAVMAFGIWFLYLSPIAYGVEVLEKQKRFLKIAVLAFLSLLALVFWMPVLSEFFDLMKPSFIPLLITFFTVFVFGFLQYQITFQWFYEKQLNTDGKSTDL